MKKQNNILVLNIVLFIIAGTLFLGVFFLNKNIISIITAGLFYLSAIISIIRLNHKNR
ncbi:MAG: hypothetical protein ACOC3Z_02290 [Nanoarchaeota archaeon]